MTAKDRWVCWELSRKEIDRIARKAGVGPGKLTAREYENIARTFEKELKKVNKQQWEIILEDVIERVVR